MTAGRVVLDLVAPQSPSYRERGIARHGLDFANALVDRHAALVDRVLLHPELPPVGGLEHLIGSGKASSDLAGVGPGGVFHVTSAFEPEVSVRKLWPRAVSALRMRLVVTVYDLIPDIFPDMYLVDPGLRRRWRSCRELARVADRVLVLSDSGAEDVVRLLGVAPHRVTVIGAGCETRFRPAASPAEALALARAGVDGLGRHFIVYNGAIDPRKNLDRLLEAYARLPGGIRDAWQLVLVCRADPLQANHYLVMAERLGVGGRVLLPGFVSDEILVALYQSADLSVFPSLYEGYGLPVVEAQACGAPVIAADNSSLRELVIEEARFDALDVEAISAAMTRALTDESLHARLVAQAHHAPPTWADVADRTAAVYEELIEGDRGHHLTPGWKHHLNVAVVSPLPASGGTDRAAGDPLPSHWDESDPAVLEEAERYGEALARALEAAGAEVDRFAEGSEPGRLHPPALPRMDHWRGGYDLVVCCIGNDAAYLGALSLLRRPDATELPIVVVAHQVALPKLFHAAAVTGGLERGLAGEIHAAYPGLPADVGATGALDPATVRRHGLIMARPVIAAARRYLAPTEADARVARIDAGPGDATKVEVAAGRSTSTSESVLRSTSGRTNGSPHGLGLEVLVEQLLSLLRPGGRYPGDGGATTDTGGALVG